VWCCGPLVLRARRGERLHRLFTSCLYLRHAFVLAVRETNSAALSSCMRHLTQLFAHTPAGRANAQTMSKRPISRDLWVFFSREFGVECIPHVWMTLADVRCMVCTTPVNHLKKERTTCEILY